ncbi:trypsin-like serine peptidase [Streptomyces monticola]|uniref:Trypsin-like serine peptidase n=1 Tax=Streptomyces monticola TaxID=2666263 RepID=A0ABW2JKH9_9ACTN
MRDRSRWLTLGSALCALALVTGCSRFFGPQTEATATDGLPSVGVLVADGAHWCTASVVDSPGRNVIATAGHCVMNVDEDGRVEDLTEQDLAFAPGFRGSGEGDAPYGMWRVKGAHLDDRWKHQADDRADFAFLTLEPDDRGRDVQDVVGASVPQWDSGFDRDVVVYGYPDSEHNPGNRQISCRTRTERDEEEPFMLTFTCGGFWTGTSGSPFLTDFGGPGRPGRVIAVLSGGETDDVSTAVLFTDATRKVYEAAVAAG